MIENVYTLKIINKDIKPHEYRLSVEGMEDIKINMQRDRIYAESGAVVELPISIEANPDNLKKRTSEFFFKLESLDSDISIVEEARFLGPLQIR